MTDERSDGSDSSGLASGTSGEPSDCSGRLIDALGRTGGVSRRTVLGSGALIASSALAGCGGLFGDGGTTPTRANGSPTDRSSETDGDPDGTERGSGADGDGGGTSGNPTQTAGVEPVDTVSVSVDVDADGSGWTVDDRVFGKFIEHNGRDVYPGIYSDHLANGSFEVWNESGTRTAVIFDTDRHDGVAYPWVPVGDESVECEQVTGGVHGRRAEPDLESGDEIIERHRPDPTGVSEPRFQRVRVDGTGGVGQRTALPDHRTAEYVAEISVRGEGLSECSLELQESTALGTETLASATVDVTGEWARHEVTLTLDAESRERYRDSPFGEYRFAAVAEGSGRLDLDWAVLRAGDAVAGKFNPTTVELLREFNVPSIRWPGGNFASQYHWRDGVGPLADRPVVPNGNWGGLERNYLGTNEFLEFCDIVGIEPLITVGSWRHIDPEEAAAWVEYVNGDPEGTEMGALRAEHGYEEPWDVTAWQVGNEVWGRWQIGHQSAADYADRYREYHEAMTAVDSSIEVDATGIDPWYTDFRDGSYEDRQFGTPPTWNRILFDRAGSVVEGVDIHRYSRGIVNGDEREQWLSAHDRGTVGYNEVLVNYPAQFGENVGMLADEASDYGIEDLQVNFGEWNLQPRVGEGWPRADYPTMAHAAFVASMYSTFMRRGDTLRLAYQRDNTLFWRPYPVDLRPVNPGNYALRFMAEPFRERDADWQVLPVAVDGPTFTMPETGVRIREMDDVPYVDATAIRSADGESIVTFVTNRNLTDAYEVAVDVGDVDRIAITLQRPARGSPFARQTNWSYVLDEPLDGFELDESTVETEDGTASIALPPSSIVKAEPVDGGGS